jgi:hypothetical protein
MYDVKLEPWTQRLWAEMRPHAEAHFAEVDGGVEPRRKFRLDEPLMKAIADAGSLKTVIARHDGSLVGYYTWNIAPDIESAGLLIAQQGAWYVDPGHPRVAVMMWDVAIASLKALGVQCVFPHHRMQGRGAHIGRFFKRRGAKKIQDSYVLWIGDS